MFNISLSKYFLAKIRLFFSSGVGFWKTVENTKKTIWYDQNRLVSIQIALISFRAW